MSSRRRLAFIVWLVLLAACALQVARTRFVADLSSFLPEAPSDEQRLLVDQLRDGALSRVMLAGIEGADEPTRARLSRELVQRLASDSRFALASNGASAGLERERGLVFDHRYVLSPQVDPERFTVAGLRSSIGATLDLLASSAGMLVKPLVARDPTGETLAIADALRPAASPPARDGVWTSRDGKRALLLARTRASGSDTDAQADAVAAMETHFHEAAAAVGDAARGAHLLLTGPGVFSAHARALVQHDVARLTTLSAALVVALLLFVYRSPTALALGLVPVASGALVGVAAVSLGFGAVHGITLGFGTTLIGEAVDYSIYLFVQAEHGERAGDAAWLAGFWPTIRLGVLTSIAGFSALLFSGLPGLAQLGLYSIAGLAAAALVTRFVLPALLPARFRIRDMSALGAAIARAARAASRLRWAVAFAAIAAIAVLWLHRATLWDPELSSLNPISRQDRALDAMLRTDLAASDARHMVVVRGATADAVLAGAEAVGARLDALVERGTLGGYDSPARFLPSAATQRARLASLPEPDALRARLREALHGMPLRPERLEPFVEDASRARTQPPLKREDLAGTAFGTALEGLLFADAAGRWTAIVGLRPARAASDAIAADAVRQAIGGVPQATFVDLKAEVDRLYEGYLQRALAMSAVGLAAIVALLAAALRDPRRVVNVMLPLLAGVAVVAAAHALAGTRLTILHLVGLLLVVAVGSNYALFFDRLALRGASAPRTLASLALANATTVASFGVLSLSDIPVLHAIGSTVALGAFLTLAFAAMLAPPPAVASR